jgi:poly(3-hydroxyalkanoate) synthetase
MPNIASKFPEETELDESIDDEKSISTDMALASAIEFMNSKKNIELKTDIPQQAIAQIVALQQEQDFTQSDIMSKFIRDFKILRVSKDRLSRKEIIELAKTRQTFDMTNTGVFSRAVNWLRGGGQQL